MENAYFFGYGSLVNCLTHGYLPAHKAVVTGWRRAWRAVPERELCFLTAEACPNARIEGLIAPVPAAGWAALDLREAAYERCDATMATSHNSPAQQIAIYAIAPPRLSQPGAQNPILLSYLDVVIQGYLAEYGRAGADRFFTGTDGWQAPILDDRATPRYARAQRLPAEQTAYVDDWLARLNCRRIAP